VPKAGQKYKLFQNFEEGNEIRVAMAGNIMQYGVLKSFLNSQTVNGKLNDFSIFIRSERRKKLFNR
jgi:hypothetical protein